MGVRFSRQAKEEESRKRVGATIGRTKDRCTRGTQLIYHWERRRKWRGRKEGERGWNQDRKGKEKERRREEEWTEAKEVTEGREEGKRAREKRRRWNGNNNNNGRGEKPKARDNNIQDDSAVALVNELTSG